MGKNRTVTAMEAQNSNMRPEPTFTVVKEPKVAKYASYTVKIAKSLLATVDLMALLKVMVDSNVPVTEKVLKSGKVTITVGKVTVERIKLSPEEKAARKQSVGAFRKLMRTDPNTAALVAKLSENGANVSDEKRAQILALLAS
jgi:hypothetical protein